MKNILCAVALTCSACLNMYAQSDRVNDYAFSWDSFSAGASESLPIGNGEVGANVWLEKNGNLVFYLSRTDAWAENSSLYKLGKIRISLFPALKGEEVAVHQFMNLKEGRLEMKMSDGVDSVLLNFLVDSSTPVVYVKGTSSYPMQVNVSSEIWRTQTRLLPASERHFALQGCPYDSLLTEYPDEVNKTEDDLVVFHRNRHSIYPFTLKHQQLESNEELPGDPFINRTMGYRAKGNGFVKISPQTLATSRRVKDFCLKIVAYTGQTDIVQEWLEQTEDIMNQAPDYIEAAHRTAAWWAKYWDKSYIMIRTPDEEKGKRITQAYILQKWMNACGGRGNYPIKFNGSIFTVGPEYTDKSRVYSPDFRMWGPDYWWQNTRLVYHPMLATGDFDMMRVLFQHYYRNLPMLKANARCLFEAEGAVNPETSTIFGTFVNHDYGWKPESVKGGAVDNPYVRYYWSSGLEIVGLMYDYYRYTQSRTFAADTLVPMGREILKFYASYFPKNGQGKLQITPTHSLETYWDGVVNDLPNVAGLHYVVKSMLSLPVECTSESDRECWKELSKALPPLPVGTVGGKQVFLPAETYDPDKRQNQENPELYAIFPFPLCNLSSAEKQVGIDSYLNRIVRHSTGWTQDGQQAARLGLTEEAARILWDRACNGNSNFCFPAYWGPNFDWTPDQNHGGNLLLTLQEMVVQVYGKNVYALPAFPSDWDVSFKLYVPGDNVVTGVYANGKWKQKIRFRKKSNQRVIYPKR